MESVLIAVGGNALYDKATGGNLSAKMIEAVCARILEILKLGYLPVVTFGNGPQVGNLLDMTETSAKRMTSNQSIPLDVCVSWTQGEIGYALSLELNRQLKRQGLQQCVMAVNTTVEVDPKDPAFQKPSKPVGKFITMEEAQQLFEERGWVIGPDANRGYRRLVPSPMPLRILEAEAIGNLIQQGVIPLCCGGGGIPVDAQLNGIEAVIDKDYTSCLLAKTLKIDNVIICTEVENVYLHFGQPNQTALRRLSLQEAQRYANEGHFSAGSMGPKIGALMDFVKSGGKRAFITSLEKVGEALRGEAGTEIYADRPLTAVS